MSKRWMIRVTFYTSVQNTDTSTTYFGIHFSLASNHVQRSCQTPECVRDHARLAFNKLFEPFSNRMNLCFVADEKNPK